MPAPTIRSAGKGDAEALSTLASRTFSENFGHLYKAEALALHLEKTCSPEFFRQSLEQGDVIFLACDQHRLIGYAKAGSLCLPVDPPEPLACELHRFYLVPDFHGQGVAAELMGTILSHPPISHSSSCFVGVWEHNIRAQRFYRRYGFEPAGEYLYRVGEHADREIIMRRGNADAIC